MNGGRTAGCIWCNEMPFMNLQIIAWRVGAPKLSERIEPMQLPAYEFQRFQNAIYSTACVLVCHLVYCHCSKLRLVVCRRCNGMMNRTTSTSTIQAPILLLLIAGGSFWIFLIGFVVVVPHREEWSFAFFGKLIGENQSIHVHLATNSGSPQTVMRSIATHLKKFKLLLHVHSNRCRIGMYRYVTGDDWFTKKQFRLFVIRERPTHTNYRCVCAMFYSNAYAIASEAKWKSFHNQQRTHIYEMILRCDSDTMMRTPKRRWH